MRGDNRTLTDLIDEAIIGELNEESSNMATSIRQREEVPTDNVPRTSSIDLPDGLPVTFTLDCQEYVVEISSKFIHSISLEEQRKQISMHGESRSSGKCHRLALHRITAPTNAACAPGRKGSDGRNANVIQYRPLPNQRVNHARSHSWRK